VIIISYHAKYPYILDSLYRANVTQNDARANYYGVLATPYASLDGVNMGQFSSVDWSSQINNEFRNSVTYMDITLTNSFNQNTDSGTVTANISLLSAVPTGDNVVHIIITESNIPYITAPNGVKYPDDVMRYMITGSDGEDITLSSNNVITKSYSLNSKWNKAECYLTVFVQSKSTKQIYGVGRIKVNQ
jgi:hypothetical protein